MRRDSRNLPEELVLPETIKVFKNGSDSYFVASGFI